MTWKYTNTHEIGKIIKSLKTKGFSGYDEITNRIIKSSSQFIISPLTHICNLILRSGLSGQTKICRSQPCFKKGNMQEISNFRSVSLLACFSKIIEKLIYARVITHIELNSILVHERFGFRTHFSTEKVAFTFINNVLTAMNSKALVAGISCDLQKAFECVNDKILMDKLEFCGIEGKFKTLINSYLIGRHQSVVLGNKSDGCSTSKWEIIKCGVRHFFYFI
jgi:hypothetical protein